MVLPAGYEVVGLTVPSQIRTEKDGRIAVSFMHAGTGEAPLVLRAVKDAQTGAAAVPKELTTEKSWEAPFAGEWSGAVVGTGLSGSRHCLFFAAARDACVQPVSRLHGEAAGDQWICECGADGECREQSFGVCLDTGEKLKTEEMSGAEMVASKINAGETVDPKDRVVVIPFPAPVKAGETLRLRIAETYTAPASYRMDGDELVFDRSLGRPRNAVVLPSGWYCTESAEPATVTQLPDGRARLDFWDDRPEAADVLLKAKRRVSE